MSESFQPISHLSPDSFIQKLILLVRLMLDFQFNTVYRMLKKNLPQVTGKLVDVGCGNSPFEHLLNKKNVQYTGLDYHQSKEFNYNRNDIVYFDGKQFPFDNHTFDFVLCTEVIEHIEEPQQFINETLRILKDGGKAIFTVPWSARFHYIPYDYFRYTPTTLQHFFKNCKDVNVKNRGTEVTVIASKIIVFYFGSLLSIIKINTSLIWHLFKAVLTIIFLILFLPFLLLTIIAGHLSILFPFGSTDDCLGYTVTLTK